MFGIKQTNIKTGDTRWVQTWEKDYRQVRGGRWVTKKSKTHGAATRWINRQIKQGLDKAYTWTIAEISWC